jgi:hypothetical protein
MKIAYIDLNIRYLNRTRNELINALKLSADIEFIGPGFSSNDPVERLRELINNPSMVDAIVLSPHIALAGGFENHNYSQIGRLYRQSFVYSFDDTEFTSMNEIRSLLLDCPIPKILLLLEADYYNFGPFEINSFNEISDAILGFGPENWSFKSHMKYLAQESFGDKATDSWATFLSNHGEKVSSFHHLVGDDEFCMTPLSQRKFSWSVLGANYAARKLAIKNLESYGIDPVVLGLKRRAIAGLRHVGLLRGESNWALNFVQEDFYKKLCSSKYSYTCGSGVEIPVRKFFEIPAAGAVLVCRPFRGMNHLGFVADESFIECEPDDLWDVHLYLEKNPDIAQKIAKSGQELIGRLHSVYARASQFKECLNALVNGGGVGRWNRGNFHVISNNFT